MRRLRMNEGDVDSGFDECADFEGREVEHELVLGTVFKRVSLIHFSWLLTYFSNASLSRTCSRQPTV